MSHIAKLDNPAFEARRLLGVTAKPMFDINQNRFSNVCRREQVRAEHELLQQRLPIAERPLIEPCFYSSRRYNQEVAQCSLHLSGERTEQTYLPLLNHRIERK